MSGPALKLPFGLRDGVLTHVGEVEAGKACGCTCPGCGAPLVAKKGTKVVHHFAHATGADCEHAVETALHLAAKNTIERAGYFVVPRVRLDFGSHKKPWLLSGAQRVVPEAVVLEHRMGGVVPDVVLIVGGKPLLVEVAVTHFVDEEKRARLAAMDLSTVEVSLSHLARDTSEGAIAAAVVDGVEHKRWIHNARVERERRRVMAAADALPVVQRGMATHVDGCPLPAREWRGRPYANVIDDCANCEFCVEPGLGGYTLLCLGRRRISTLEDWQRARSGPKRSD